MNEFQTQVMMDARAEAIVHMDARRTSRTSTANRSVGVSDLSPDNPAHRNGAPYWLIVRDTPRETPTQDSREVEILSLGLDTPDSGAANGRVLPVFRSEAQAGRFVATLAGPVEAPPTAVNGGWRVRGTGAGELISVLSGSSFSAGLCAGVERVIVDPPPELVEDLASGAPRGLAKDLVGEAFGVSRSTFLERLMGRGRPWFQSGR